MAKDGIEQNGLRRKGWNQESKRAKVVEPNGHGEATRGHELHLHESASINPMTVVPEFVSYRLGHDGLIVCG